MKSNILKETKIHCLESLERKGDHICEYLPRHIAEVEKWAKRMSRDYPRADKTVLFLSVLLHDIGHGFGSHKDHAVKSEIEAKRFLKRTGLELEKIEKISHCIRAHRCKDVQPETIEAKILAAADSASHMTDGCYIDMAVRGAKNLALEKLERDYRDTNMFPKLRKIVTPLYKSWRKLLGVYPY